MNKPKIPTGVEMKLEAAKQCELSIARLAGYDYIIEQIKEGHTNIVIPKDVFQRFQNWAESQAILERSNIHSYGE